MDSLILSRITKDYLNLDPDFTLSKDRYRMGWSGSSLIRHKHAEEKEERKSKAMILIELKKRLDSLFDPNEEGEFLPPPHPKLTPPKIAEPTTFRPPWYFSKGALDYDRNKTPSPIPYLIIETSELDKARAVPGKMGLLKSLCKGKGVLKQTSQGLVYLDIDNRFITMMLPFLKNQNLARPPYFNLFSSPDGAHIPIITPRERDFHYLEQIEGIGSEIFFEIEGLYSVQPTSWPEVEQVWFFKIHSETLENFRRNQFLPPLPGGHPFQITVAIKPKGAQVQEKTPLPPVHINKGFIAA